jgi:hypothetical protein
MKMNKLILGALTLASLSAQASMLELNGPLDEALHEAQVNVDSSYFETLGKLFRKGKIPKLSKIMNIAWAGRCFTKAEQNEPTNGGYIFREVKLDVGPIASTSKVYEAFSYWQLSKAPNFFDQMNLEQVFNSVKNIKSRSAKIKKDSIELDLEEGVKSNLRISKNYLVEEITSTERTGGVSARCYFFIPDLKN